MQVALKMTTYKRVLLICKAVAGMVTPVSWPKGKQGGSTALQPEQEEREAGSKWGMWLSKAGSRVVGNLPLFSAVNSFLTSRSSLISTRMGSSHTTTFFGQKIESARCRVGRYG